MDISRDELKQYYESRATAELANLYINDGLTDVAMSVLRDCLSARGEQLHLLDAEKEKKSIYVKSEAMTIQEYQKKGRYSIFNFRRWSTKLAFLVGLPICVYLQVDLGWNVGLSILVVIVPLWAVFAAFEMNMIGEKIASLSDAELKDILNAKEGQPGYELQNIAETEIKRRFSKQ